MCSNQVMKCLLNIQSSLPNSDAYLCKKDFKTNEIKILFKDKLKLLTGIDENTTFDDLKLAILISYYQSSNKMKRRRLKKTVNELQDMVKDFVVCESINNVEKVINSSLLVQNELHRIAYESTYLGEFKVRHVMRNLKTIKALSQHESSDFFPANKVPILEEFLKSSDKFQDYKDISATFSQIDISLKKFDFFIDDRKSYIKLLEEYLSLMNELDMEDCEHYFPICESIYKMNRKIKMAVSSDESKGSISKIECRLETYV